MVGPVARTKQTRRCGEPPLGSRERPIDVDASGVEDNDPGNGAANQG